MAKLTSTVTATGIMVDRLRHWTVKLAGIKPDSETIERAGGFLRRTGTAKHLGLAMYLRSTGATQPEVNSGTGDTQINAYYDAIRNGDLEPVTPPLPARNGHKVYALRLPVKGKGKGKGKGKAKATPKATGKASVADKATDKGKGKGKGTVTPKATPKATGKAKATPKGNVEQRKVAARQAKGKVTLAELAKATPKATDATDNATDGAK